LKLIVGLGNPGTEYRHSRHNIGFRIVQAFAEERRVLPWRKRFHGKIAVGEGWLLLLPQTFMNLSGLAVAGASCFYHTQAEEILVIHDDVDLPLGEIRFKHGGSSAGHQGLASILQYVRKGEFDRLRFGVGRENGKKALEFILEPFLTEDEGCLPALIEQARRGIDCWLGEGIAVCMNRFNRKNLLAP